MSILSNMTDKTVMRAYPWIWYIRLVQIVISVIVLALAAADSHSVQNFAPGCGVPPRIAYNLACAVIAIFALIYFILATGPSNAFKLLPWLVWGQIALDALMFVFWLAAAATSNFTFHDLCAACPYDGVYYGNYFYSCLDNSYIYGRDLSPFPRGLAGVERRAGAVRRAKKGAAPGRSALDAIMTILFLITLVATIWWVFTQQRSSGTAASTTHPTTNPPAHGEAGVPMTSTQQPTPLAPNPQAQPAQYYVVQGQLQQQQQPQEQQYVNQQSVPQVQYPPQPQQQSVYQKL